MKKGGQTIISSEPLAYQAAEPVDTVRPAILPAAVFILVEIVLVAETISVILLKELEHGNPGAGPIAVLLSVALLANLGVVCGVAAAVAAQSVRPSNLARSLLLYDRFPSDLSAPVWGAFRRPDPEQPPNAETDEADREIASFMPASG